MMKKEDSEHFGIASYIFGWISIIFSILQPAFGLGFGIVGLILSSKTQNLKKESRKLNIIGIILSILFSALLAALTGYLTAKGIGSLSLK